MDWQALRLSVWLAGATALVLLPLGVLVGRWLATGHGRVRQLVEAALALPLVLPPTVLGFYLLVAMGGSSPLGQAYNAVFGHTLAFCWKTLWRVELPLAWRGILSGLIMTATHTLGEFGVVLMVGGSIPGETKTIAISIYDRVQGFDMHAAGVMSATLLLASLVTLLATTTLGRPRHVRSVP